MRDFASSSATTTSLLKKKLVRRSLSVTVIGFFLFLYVDQLQKTEKYAWMRRMTFRVPKSHKKRNHLPVGGTPKNHEDYDDIIIPRDEDDEDVGDNGRWEDRSSDRKKYVPPLGELRFDDDDVERTTTRSEEEENVPPVPDFLPPPNVSPPPVTAEMERKFHSQSKVRVDKMSFPNAPDELIEVVNRMGLHRGSAVVVSFANSHHIELAVNFILWAKAIGMTTLIGALDDDAFEILKKTVGDESHGGEGQAFTYRVDHHLEAQGSSHASKAWKNFAKMRISHATSLLEFGFDVVMSDADVVWLKNPEEYLKCEKVSEDGKVVENLSFDIDGCEELKAADVIVSSDNLSPTSDERDGGNYAKGGVFNTGIVLLRHTKGGIQWAKQWNLHLSATDGRFHRLTSDQQVFNAMSRKENAWPGLEVMRMDGTRTLGPKENKRVLVAAEGDTLLGVFPVAKFNPGHVYMVQKFHEKEKKTPFAVHATYTFDGSSGDAKKWRFMEAGLWRVPEEEREEKFITFDASAHLWDDDAVDDHGAISSHDTPSITDHLVAGSGHIKALANAMAVAASLKRTLLIPPMPCWCDKVWGGHDNIFTFQCHYPGSRDSNHIPGTCPLDHFVSPSKLAREAKVNGVNIKPLGAAPESVKIMRDEFPTLKVGGGKEEEQQQSASSFAIPTHATELEISKLSNRLPLVIKLETTRDAFGGFTDRAKTKQFEHSINDIGLFPEQWCSECHPQGCKNLIPAATIAKGVLKLVREVHDQFCASFDKAGKFDDSHDDHIDDKEDTTTTTNDNARI